MGYCNFMIKMAKFLSFSFILFCLLAFSLLGVSSYLKPEPAFSSNSTTGAVVRVYGADVWGVRGHFAIHTWIATKTAEEQIFTIHQVIGWKLRRNGTALSVSTGNPNRPWYNSPAVLLHELSGRKADQLVPLVRQAANDYPYAGTYRMWPGPNSNSFMQWIALTVPELGLLLPAKAIGQSWMTDHISN